MKNSFTLIETLTSIILLSIIISGFINLSFESVDFKNHINIQTLKNKIVSNNFSDFMQIKTDLVIDENTISYLDGSTYQKFIYTGEFKLIYHDIPFQKQTLKSKTYE